MTETSHPEVRLRWNDPLAVDLTATVQRGDAARLRRILARRPEFARVRIVKDGESAGTRTLLWTGWCPSLHPWHEGWAPVLSSLPGRPCSKARTRW